MLNSMLLQIAQGTQDLVYPYSELDQSGDLLLAPRTSCQSILQSHTSR